MDQTTREHLEYHLRRLKGARAAAAELSLKPVSGGLELLGATHFAVQALEAVLLEGLEPDHSALAEVVADLAGEASPQAAASPAPTQVAEWWRATLAPLGMFAETTRPR